jgi:hypothetical protein
VQIEDLLVAYKMQPEPRLLFNIAQSHRKLGESAKAKEYFTQYLKADKDISAEKRGEIERYLAELRVLPPRSNPALVEVGPIVPKVPLWPKVLGPLLIVGGAGVAISGITFLALDGKCSVPPEPLALECGRVYQLFNAGVAQTALGGGLLLAGTLTLVIPYAVTARARRAASR